MHLDAALVNEEGQSWALPADLYSNSGALGLYSPDQFMVRIDQRLYSCLSAYEGAPFLSWASLSSEAMSAYSTYFHETIHWWQHIGSTLGLDTWTGSGEISTTQGWQAAGAVRYARLCPVSRSGFAAASPFRGRI